MEWDFSDYRNIESGEPEPDVPIGTAPPDIPSLTVLDLDDWSLRRGREIGRIAGADEYAAADFHAAAFEPHVEWATSPTDERRAEFLRELLNQPEYKATRNSTMLDTSLSEIAAADWLREYKRFTMRDDKERRKDEKTMPPEKCAARAQRRVQVAAMAAANQGQTGVDEVAETCEILDPYGEGQQGTSVGKRAGKQDGVSAATNSRNIRQVFDRVKNDRKLRRIMEWAGRFIAVAKGKQSCKREQGPDEVIGIECGDELAKTLTSELMLYVGESTRSLFFQKYADKQLLQRETEAPTPSKQGPMLLFVDGSGSMGGTSIEMAKGFACAFAWVAAKQRRHCALVEFGSKRQRKPIVFKPGEHNPSGFADWLAHFFDGGTNPPIDELPEWFQKTGSPTGKTDVVILSDGEWGMAEHQLEKCLADKEKLQAKIITVMIDGSDSGDADRVSDKVYKIPSLSPDSKVAGDILGL